MDKGSTDRQGTGSWWSTLPGVLTGAAAVITALTGVAALFWSRSEVVPRGEQTAPTAVRRGSVEQSSPEAPSSKGYALPKVVLADTDKLSFVGRHPGAYTVLDMNVSRRTSAQYELRIRVRYENRSNGYTGYLHDGKFRLLVDTEPLAPDSKLHVTVDHNSARDGELTFEVPVNAKTLVLQVLHDANEGYVADIPLRVIRNP